MKEEKLIQQEEKGSCTWPSDTEKAMCRLTFSAQNQWSALIEEVTSYSITTAFTSFFQFLLFYSFLLKPLALFLSPPTRVVKLANWTLLVLLLFIPVRFSLVQLSRRQLWGLSVCFFRPLDISPLQSVTAAAAAATFYFKSFFGSIWFVCVSASLRTGLLLINCCCCHCCCCYTVYLCPRSLTWTHTVTGDDNGGTLIKKRERGWKCFSMAIEVLSTIAAAAEGWAAQVWSSLPVLAKRYSSSSSIFLLCWSIIWSANLCTVVHLLMPLLLLLLILIHRKCGKHTHTWSAGNDQRHTEVNSGQGTLTQVDII